MKSFEQYFEEGGDHHISGKEHLEDEFFKLILYPTGPDMVCWKELSSDQDLLIAINDWAIAELELRRIEVHRDDAQKENNKRGIISAFMMILTDFIYDHHYNDLENWLRKDSPIDIINAHAVESRENVVSVGGGTLWPRIMDELRDIVELMTDQDGNQLLGSMNNAISILPMYICSQGLINEFIHYIEQQTKKIKDGRHGHPAFWRDITKQSGSE